MSNDRTALIKVRVSTNERAAIVERAGKAGVTMSEFVRRSALGATAEAIKRDGPRESPNVPTELNRPETKKERLERARAIIAEHGPVD